jgi:Putative DNA-binding domain
LRTLQQDGKAFFLVEPSILFSQPGKKYLQDLSTENYFVNAVFELPEKILYPETAFQPIIISFEKTEHNKLFIGEITSDFETLSENYLKNSSGDNLSNGLLIDSTNFESFNKFRIEAEINSLKTQYKDYTKYNLNEIATEINLTKTIFENKPNSIYIPKIGTSQVVSEISNTTLKHQNYFQVVLDESKVKAEFLALFYRSELGKLILKSLTSGSFIPNINKSDIQSSFVAVPKLTEQNLLILTNQKLSELQETINQLKTELSLNPKNAGVILDKFESIQSPLKQLSEEDLIFSLIRKGENKHIEFKETFSKNIRTGQKDKEIEKSSLKNIVGFLNADGGTLIIGVSDDGTVTGIEDDFFQNVDKYKLNFKNALNTKVGSEFYSLIDYDLFSVSGKLVLKVDCKPSSDPCFYDETEFYVRTNPATDRLEGKKQVDYIRTRFK